MIIELTEAEARLIKTLLQNEITNDELEAERRDELVYYLWKRKENKRNDTKVRDLLITGKRM
jgi:hypothetical protein